MSKKAVAKLVLALGPVVLRRTIMTLLRLNIVRHSAGKLILTQGGRYLARTLGIKAGLTAASGPVAILIGALMIGIDIYTLVQQSSAAGSVSVFSKAGFDPMSWMPSRG